MLDFLHKSLRVSIPMKSKNWPFRSTTHTCDRGLHQRRKGAEGMKTAEDIRRALEMRYPDDDGGFILEHSGFIHEHPMTALGVVLISSMVLGTTDVIALPTSRGIANASYAPSPGTWRTAVFGRIASMTAQDGPLTISCLATNMRMMSSGFTLQ